MAYIESFRDLAVYKLSRGEAKKIFEVTKGFPAEERYALTGQVRRSSRAVGSMLAEAWARRRYRAAFVSKLTEALGEAMETQSWLDSALDCDYIDTRQHAALNEAWQGVGGGLSRMIDRAEQFCHQASS